MARDQWNPEQYHRFQKERAQPFYDLLALIEPLALGAEPTHAIDLGCGTGELTAELHRILGLTTTLGIDSSAKMLAQAETHATASLTFLNQRIEDFQAQEAYDLVFSNAALQWCENHRQIFHTCRKALRPGGQLAIQMPMNHDYPTHTLARQMCLEAPYRDFFPTPSPSPMLQAEEYAHLLFRWGFGEQKVFTSVYAHALDDRSQVIEWVKGTLLTSIESRLPPPLYALFLDEYRNRLFEKLAEDRPFFYPFKRILIWGRLPI